MTSLLMGLLGIAAGLVVSGGVFTALLALGLVPRFAGRTHTANHILTYESAVVTGCIVGGLLSIFPVPEILAHTLYTEVFFETKTWQTIVTNVSTIGNFFAGCFVGCVALAIAEMLDSIPIFARRIRFREGVGIVVIVVAAAKVLAGLAYFGFRVYESTL